MHEEAKEEALNKEQKVKEVKLTRPRKSAISSPCPSPRIHGQPGHAQIRAGTRGVVSVKKRRPARHMSCLPYYR